MVFSIKTNFIGNNIYLEEISVSFIGIITDKKSENDIANCINNSFNKKNIKENVIIINNKNMNNIKNIKFDSLLINKKLTGKSDIVKKILSNSNNLIINSDIDAGLDILKETSSNIITYGFNPKSTVTASSLENDDALICIQRNIKSSNNRIVEPQEIKVEKINENNNPYIIMSVEILTLLYDT